MTIVPLLPAFYFLDRALQTSLNLGFNPQIVQALENSSRNLKALKDLDAENTPKYREQFQRAQPTVFVLDDEQNIRKASEIASTLEGIQVVAAHGVASAVRVLTERIVDLAIVETIGDSHNQYANPALNRTIENSKASSFFAGLPYAF
jgi:hypothetical protein